MLLSIKQELRLQWNNVWQMGLVILGMFLFGAVLVCVLVGIGVADTSATMASLFALIGLAFWFFCVGAQVAIGLPNAIIMSRPRKNYLVAHYVVNILYTVVEWMLVLLLFRLDKLMLGTFFPAVKIELDVTDWPISVWLIAAVCVGGVVVSTFLGALMVRFGKKGFWTLWALWMFTFLVLPRASEAAERSGSATIIGQVAIWTVNAIRSVPLEVWKGIGVVAFFGCILSSVLMLRRHAVTN